MFNKWVASPIITIIKRGVRPASHLPSSRGPGCGASRVGPRALALLALALAVMTIGCWNWEDPYKTNPDLTLLLSRDGHYLFKPAVSPDGQDIYYLDDTNHESWQYPPASLKGYLCVYHLEDSADRVLLAGSFFTLAISRDGERLALLTMDESYHSADSTLFIVMETRSQRIESLYVRHPGVSWRPWCLGLDSTGQRLIFSTWRGESGGTLVYAVGLGPDTSLCIVCSLPTSSTTFDLLAGDTLLVDSQVNGGQPRANPMRPAFVIRSRHGQLSWYWDLLDRTTGQRSPLGSQTRPYSSCFVDWPSWMPGGRDMVFCAEADRDEPTARMEIWCLKNALPDSVNF